jgi:hypothetical protein
LSKQKKAALTTLKEKYADKLEIAFDDDLIKMTNIEDTTESKQETV